MQFSDLESSSSSSAPTPVEGPQKGLQQPRTGGGHNMPGGLDSAVRAFTGSLSLDTPFGRANGDLRGRSSDEDDTHYRSSLQIDVTAGTQGSPMTTATRTRTFAPHGSDGSTGAPLAAQKAPPFFAQKSPAPVDPGVGAGATTPIMTVGGSKPKAPQLVQSSSSSASTLSLELPGVRRAVRPKGASSARKTPQGRLDVARSTSSSSVSSSRGSSPGVVAAAVRKPNPRRSPSSSSESSTSEIVFHRLSFPKGTTAAHAAPPLSSTGAVWVPPLAHKDPTTLVTAVPVAAPAVDSLVDNARTSPIAASTVAAASQTTSALETGATRSSPYVTAVSKDDLLSGRRGPSPSSPLRNSVTQAATGVSSASEASLSPANAPAVAYEASATLLHCVGAQEVGTPYREANILSDVDEEALDSSAASLAVQAALDAAEERRQQQDQADMSLLTSATPLHALPITPSQRLQPLEPHTLTDAPQPTSQQSLVKAKVPGAEEVGTSMTLADDTPLCTVAVQRDSRLADAPEATVGCVSAAAVTFPSTETGPRRKPPPLPPLFTNSTVSQPSHSAMRPDDDSNDDETEGDDQEHSLSKSETDLTIEQQQAPATHGTLTHSASVEAAQAAVMHSFSLLPPTPSSSSGNSGGADAIVFSPPHKEMERSGTLEDDDGGTLRSAVRVGGGDVKAVPAAGVPSTVMELKNQQLRHIPSTHGETQTAALATTATTGDESLSRLSGVLMPPSPSQQRRSLSPHANSLNSIHASNAAIGSGVGSAAASPSPPVSMHLSEVDAAESSEGKQMPLVQSTTGVARMLPAPSSSSSSSSSFSNDGLSVHEDAGYLKTEIGKQCGDEVGDIASVKTAGGHKPRLGGVPTISSGDDDDEDDCDSDGDKKGIDSAAAAFAGNSASRTATSSSSEAESSSSMPTRMERAVAAHAFGDNAAGNEDTDAAARTPKHTLSNADADENEREESQDEEDDWRDNAGAGRSDSETESQGKLQNSERWGEVLKAMDLIDCTLVSQVFQQTIHRRSSESSSDAEESEEAGEDVCLFKVLTPFPILASDERARWSRRTELQQRLLELAQSMLATQRALDEAGLTAAGVERTASGSKSKDEVDMTRPTRTTCSGVSAVYVDASCRLIAQLEAEPYMIPLRHLLPAACSTGLHENEILALLRSVVYKTAVMHNAGFVHGALHSGNVLLSSYDGDTVLTQPCGLMSQSSFLPSDLSVLSVARACAMTSLLPRVWGAHRQHMQKQTSARLGTPSRPDIKELITYHNLAVLGWYGDERDTAEDSSACIRGDEVYTPTTADDLYALGLMAFLLYFGVPPFHMTSLWAAVKRLGVLASDYEAAVASSSRQEARRHIAKFCFGECRVRGAHSTAAMQPTDFFTCSYGSLQRHAVGRLRPKFEQALQSFIVDCVEASCVEAISSGRTASLPQDSKDASRNKKNILSRISNSSLPYYHTAQDLLDSHVLFHDFDDVDSSNGGEVEERMRDTVHRVVYPAFCSLTRARKDCGSAPHLARMHSNALYTARNTSLCESLLAATTAHPQDQSEGASTTVLSALCPEVAGTLQAWQPCVPSLDANADPQCWVNRTATTDGKATEAEGEDEYTSRTRSPASMFKCTAMLMAEGHNISSLVQPSEVAAPSWLTHGDGHDEDAMSEATEDALVTQLLQGGPSHALCCEFRHLPHLRTLVLAHTQSGAYGLSRPFILARLSYATDTLVLQHLQDCIVTLLAPFRYVVLDDVVRCEVRLGPCEVCVLRDVHDCPLVAVAAHRIAGARVRNTLVSWGGHGGRTPPLAESSNVSFSLYGLVYSGLVEDYRRVGLPLEHVASLCTLEGSVDDDALRAGERDYSSAMHRRTFEIVATAANACSQNEIALCLTPEAPYAHALLAAGTRYVHRGNLDASLVVAEDQGRQQQKGGVENDVYHFFGELRGKDVLVCDVHGSKEGELPTGEVSRPVVFIHDVLGDVTVERCSFCTVMVIGTPSSLQATDCHNCQLVFMARESILERCTQVDCIALVTEFLLVKSCSEVLVRPLFLDCPYSDEVLQKVVMGSLGGQEEEMVVGAYEAGRLDLLNAVLRGVGHGVNVEKSEGVMVEDVHYYSQNNGSNTSGAQHEEGGTEKWLSLLTLPYSVVHQRPRGEEDELDAVHSDSSEIMVEAAQALAEHLSLPAYTEVLQRYEDPSDAIPAAEQRHSKHTVTFHDLLDCSVLRLRGALCPVQSKDQVSSGIASEDDTASTPTLLDVCIARVQFGVLYIEDSVGTLQLSHCVGPLDVVVCAATSVVMEHCTDVQLRTACVDFRATNCTGCHVALHVNSLPQYQRCSSMETSVLNITASYFDTLLAAAGVDMATNQFHTPVFLSQSCETSETVRAPAPALAAAAIHAYCSGDVAAVPDNQTSASLCAELVSFLSRSGGDAGARVPPEQTPLIMALLHQPVTVVSPLPGLCVSPCEAPFIEELESQVARWSRQCALVCRADMVEIALRALADVSGVYLDSPEGAAATAVTAGATEKRFPATTPLTSADDGAATSKQGDAATEESLEAIEQTPQEPADPQVGEGLPATLEEEIEKGGATQPAAAAALPGASTLPEAEHSVEAAPSACRKQEALAEVKEGGDIHKDDDDEGVQVNAVRSEEEKPQPSHVAVVAASVMAAHDSAAEAEAMETVVAVSQQKKEVQQQDVGTPQPDETLLQASATDAVSQKASSASDSDATVVVSPQKVLAEEDVHDLPAEVYMEDLISSVTVVPAAAAAVAYEVHHDPAAGLCNATHAANRSPAAQASLRSFSSSSPPPEYHSGPLPSQSPQAILLGPYARDRDDFHATVAAPIVGISASSSVGMPPMAPGPAYALAATDVGSSTTMDIFNAAYPSGVTSSVMEPLDKTGMPSRDTAFPEEADLMGELTHVNRSLSEPRLTLAVASPIIAAPLVKEREGGMGLPQLGGAPPLAATINSFPRGPEADWIRSPGVGALDSRSDGGGGCNIRREGSVEDRQPTENAAITAAANAADVSKLITPVPPPGLREQEDEMEFSPQTSSSVSDYPHRGVLACEESTPRCTGLEDNEARRASMRRQATTYLHFSEDSSSRRGEYSLQPDAMPAGELSPLVQPDEHRTPGSGSFSAQVSLMPEVITVHGVDAGVKELLRQVEEARQRYERRQQQQQQQGLRLSEALRVRVESAVAKLKFMKASAEMT
ncbi:hypothetical protein ABL78_0831 [Leptomonas seymouri]|uniref:C-CAP/cofactor C-like domain-containing protein n=1 Tax=Leptomonas seymouri TaxID=5684 RepID=A0A0N1I898_LEPSE|nr:hypothetical protein ABL78_0831 [Leptomonas seymouri]|eukprot:KPI90078.1 hypothetical protein ABL78_0831 [Leptomonas seymouri]